MHQTLLILRLYYGTQSDPFKSVPNPYNNRNSRSPVLARTLLGIFGGVLLIAALAVGLFGFLTTPQPRNVAVVAPLEAVPTTAPFLAESSNTEGASEQIADSEFASMPEVVQPLSSPLEPTAQPQSVAMAPAVLPTSTQNQDAQIQPPNAQSTSNSSTTAQQTAQTQALASAQASPNTAVAPSATTTPAAASTVVTTDTQDSQPSPTAGVVATPEATATPTALPTATAEPTATVQPTATPTVAPTATATATPTPSPTATPIPATPTPTPTPSDDTNIGSGSELTEGWLYVDSSEGLFLREEPAGQIKAVMNYGDQVFATGEVRRVEGRLWMRLQIPANGWTALEYLSSTKPVVPTPVPHDPSGEPPSAQDWEELRQCEAGGDYTMVDASGLYHGAYQFLPSTWDGLARRVAPELVGVLPSNASPADQDRMAFALYELQGSSPWPVCGRHLN